MAREIRPREAPSTPKDSMRHKLSEQAMALEEHGSLEAHGDIANCQAARGAKGGRCPRGAHESRMRAPTEATCELRNGDVGLVREPEPAGHRGRIWVRWGRWGRWGPWGPTERGGGGGRTNHTEGAERVNGNSHAA